MKNEELNQLGADLSNLLNDKKREHLEQVIEKTITDQMILKEVLKGLRSKKETFRYNCFKVFF